MADSDYITVRNDGETLHAGGIEFPHGRSAIRKGTARALAKLELIDAETPKLYFNVTGPPAAGDLGLVLELAGDASVGWPAESAMGLVLTLAGSATVGGP